MNDGHTEKTGRLRQWQVRKELELRAQVINAMAALRGMGVPPVELGLPPGWNPVLREALPAAFAGIDSQPSHYLGLLMVPDRRLTVYSSQQYGRFLVLDVPLEKP